jgi:hypothetical protein
MKFTNTPQVIQKSEDAHGTVICTEEAQAKLSTLSSREPRSAQITENK